MRLVHCVEHKNEKETTVKSVWYVAHTILKTQVWLVQCVVCKRKVKTKMWLAQYVVGKRKRKKPTVWLVHHVVHKTKVETTVWLIHHVVHKTKVENYSVVNTSCCTQD